MIKVWVRPAGKGVDFTPQGGCRQSQNAKIMQLNPINAYPLHPGYCTMPLVPEKFLLFTTVFCPQVVTGQI